MPQKSHIFSSQMIACSLLELTKRKPTPSTLSLPSYQLAFGQLVSLDKSEVSFSRNVPENEKEIICNKIGVMAVTSHTEFRTSGDLW